VARHFQATQGLARTTVLTVMERLRKKGFLARREHQGVFEYASKQPKETWVKQQIHDFVEGTLGGVILPLVAYLADNPRLSAREQKELERLVQSLAEPKEGR
jgi:predicted transcriptional regulator